MILPTIGELREQIDIVNVTAPYDLSGSGTQASIAVSGIWAKIEPLGGDIGAETMQIQNCTQAYRVWIRYRTDLNPWMQIQWGTKQLVITGPIEPMEKRFLLIHAEERTSRKL